MINNLSNELLIEIFHYIYSAYELANVAICCKRFSLLSEPFLYSAFTQTGRHSVGLLIRTLSTKPYLARYFKHLHGICIDDALPQLDLSILDQDARDWIRRQLSDQLYGSEFCDTWLSKLFYLQNWDTAMALLLVLFSESLESVCIENFPTGWELQDINGVLEIMSVAQSTSTCNRPLRNLSSVTLNYSDQIYFVTFGLELAIPWLRLPSVKAFQTHGGIHEIMPFDNSHVFSTTSLIMKYNNLDSEFFRGFLSCFTSLKHFEYELSIYHGQRHLATITEGLSESKHCLESLVLLESDGNSFLPSSYFSLGDFEVLKQLDVDARIATSFREQTDYGVQVECLIDVVPNSLESLILRNCDHTHKWHIKQFIEKKPSNLQAIKLVYWENTRIHDKEKLKLEELALTSGIVLTVEVQKPNH